MRFDVLKFLGLGEVVYLLKVECAPILPNLPDIVIPCALKAVR